MELKFIALFVKNDNDHFSVLDTNQKLTNFLIKKEVNRVLKIDYLSC